MKENTVMLTKQMLLENPLRSLIQLKKNIRGLETSCCDDVLLVQSMVRIIEEHDTGYIVSQHDVRVALRLIIGRLSYITYRDKCVLSYLFESKEFACKYAKGIIE